MEHIAGNVYAEFISPGCNVGVIATPKGTVIADTPLIARQARAIEEALQESGHEPVRYIAITHPHHDHILGTELFGPDTLVIGSRGAREGMATHDPADVKTWTDSWPWNNPNDPKEMIAAPVRLPEVVFDEEFSLYLGGTEIQFFGLPGHMAAVTGIFVPKEGVLITGDALFNGHHPYMGTANFEIWLKSLDKMRAVKAKRIIPGHGPACGYEAVDKQQRYTESIMKLRDRWDPDSGKPAPAGALEELVAAYPLHGRAESFMRERLTGSIRVAGAPQF